MIQTRAVQSQADAHRQDLMAVGRSASSGRGRAGARRREPGATQRSATGLPVPGGRAVRRAVGTRLGAWLIEFGTKLGGATIRTS